MNILDELWYGNINPQEQNKDNNRAIKELLNLMGRNRDQLHATMTPEQQVVLEKYDDCVNEMYGLIEAAVYAARWAAAIPQSKIKDFCQLPLHKGAFATPQNMRPSTEKAAILYGWLSFCYLRLY